MPDLLVVVLEVGPQRLGAALAEVDRPGQVLREGTADRSDDLLADAAAVLAGLDAAGLASRLLALAVAVAPDVDPAQAAALLAALGTELPDGWGLPATLPVVAGRADEWAAKGSSAASRPAVAGAVVHAARSVGAHAHLPHRPEAGEQG